MDNKIELTLKWGTLKSWNFSGSRKCQKLMTEYEKIGSTFSAMNQNDDDRQKEIICELIDLCNGNTIYIHWDGKEVPKDRAKAYVIEYNR